ncbi:component of SufBCD complex [Thioclava sp. GXIMD4216]|uniref:component of SufBCD complex n=1 Tax=Thioclava sp. GXIMD4216 TaxID=3131929 RepID=UPI0030D59955
MDFTNTIFALIDMHSFSSLWYWIMLAVCWSFAAHFAMGIPYDLVTQYRRNAETADDLVLAAGLSARRLIRFSQAKAALTGGWFFLTSFLLITGFGYGAELAQAAFLLGVPLSFVTIMTLYNAKLLLSLSENGQAEAIANFVHGARFRVQLLGMSVIFVTALWGMLSNLLSQTIRLW